MKSEHFCIRGSLTKVKSYLRTNLKYLVSSNLLLIGLLYFENTPNRCSYDQWVEFLRWRSHIQAMQMQLATIWIWILKHLMFFHFSFLPYNLHKKGNLY